MENFNKYKAYIVRAVVGAVIAILLAYVGGMNAWLVGAIIALVAVPASNFVEGHLDNQLSNMKNKSSKVSEDAEKTAAEKKPAVKKTIKKAVKKAN